MLFTAELVGYHEVNWLGDFRYNNKLNQPNH
jgi:hypothetical protein